MVQRAQVMLCVKLITGYTVIQIYVLAIIPKNGIQIQEFAVSILL